MVYVLLWMILIIPWLSLFLIKKHELKRFMPASILASLLVTIIFEMSYVYNWWTVQKAIAQWGHITSIPLVYGAFLIGTIWIFRYTFDKGFWFYIIANAIVDALYAFIGLNILIYFGIYRLENMGNFGIFLLMTILALIVYLYQRWQDTIMKKE